MNREGNEGVTQLLLAWREGDGAALDRLMPIVYAELHRLAHFHMQGEREGHLLQTTALVHEAYVRLIGQARDWQGRGHFFAVAAQVMRRILVDFARRRGAEKRGGGAVVVPLDEATFSIERADELVRLDDALDAFARIDARKAKVVELRFFGGLSIEDTANALDLSHATVERDLKFARAWLQREMGAAPAG
ncbi:MAG TPA: sigma-70 family RNA polymerase sigma factor [Thermoanaerobaculia bacterium]|nr:sigma-70 family RNA polymerase sigma factor [Thermoanaerobaculia bacterium]